MLNSSQPKNRPRFDFYYYQLSDKARRKFDDKALALKIRCSHGQLTSFPTVTETESPVASRFSRFAANDVKDRQVATGIGASWP